MSGITSVNSYPPTVAAFANHWQQVNGALTPNALVLPDGMTSADFTQKQAEMDTAFSVVIGAGVDARQASAALALARDAFQPRFVQFGQALRLYLSQTLFAGMAPKAPNTSAGLKTFSEQGEKMREIWFQLNGATNVAPFVPPLLLPDFSTPPSSGYTLAQFQTGLANLKTFFDQDTRAETAATMQRARRNVMLPPLREAMRNYRAACLLTLPKNSPLLATLPRLTPPAGTTPRPIVASGAWDNPLLKARLTWPAAVGSDLSKLQVRGCTGGSYKADDEEIVADLATDATHWEGDWGLTAPSSIATFKVYVMTNTDNESGGKAVKIVRPAT